MQTVSIILPLFIAPTCTLLVLKEKFKAQRLAEENQHLANTDVLTELPNRRAFFNAQLGSSSDAPGELAYIICDIDGFKQFNDRFGHDTGDQVLIHVARTIQSTIPEGAFVARLGGEEFGIKISVESEEHARQLAEQMVASISRASLIFGGQSHNVTISAGVCIVSSDFEQSKAMSSADKAMYRAKSQGKNRVVLAA